MLSVNQLIAVCKLMHFFDAQISKHHMCFEVHVVQEYEIKERQPAFVRVYDYYEGSGRLILNSINCAAH